MKLSIMGLDRAMEYIPTDPTYAIRIASKPEDFRFALQNSGLYTTVEYLFDDDHPGLWGKVSEDSITIDGIIAGKILSDFKEKGTDKETLLVHCSRGKNRSPAVGIALNEIFALGNDTGRLKKEYPEANWYVYRVLIETSKRSPNLK